MERPSPKPLGLFLGNELPRSKLKIGFRTFSGSFMITIKISIPFDHDIYIEILKRFFNICSNGRFLDKNIAKGDQGIPYD